VFVRSLTFVLLSSFIYYLKFCVSNPLLHIAVAVISSRKKNRAG